MRRRIIAGIRSFNRKGVLRKKKRLDLRFEEGLGRVLECFSMSVVDMWVKGKEREDIYVYIFEKRN